MIGLWLAKALGQLLVVLPVKQKLALPELIPDPWESTRDTP